MAELYQVVGAILRDITQARVTSDLYSRAISLQYEQDSLLRRFPVPRADITEVEIDLKFAISRVAVDPARRDARDARVSMILENYSSALTHKTADTLKARAVRFRAAPNLAADQSEAGGAAEAKLQSRELRGQLRTRLLRYLEDNQSKLIDANGKFNVDMARGEVQRLSADLAEGTPEVSKFFATMQAGPQEASDEASREVNAELESLSREIQEAYKSTQEYKVEIEVDAAKLAQLPQPVVSSVKIKSVIRNYTWSKVETDPKTLRASRVLVPDN
jgi:hypothetical protein